MNAKQTKKLIWIVPLTLALLLSACGKSDNKANDKDKAANTSAQTESTNSNKDKAKTEEADKKTEEAAKPAVDPNMKEYENAANGFSLQYPKEWSLQEGAAGTVAAFLSPAEGTSDTFQENITVTVQDLSQQPMDLKAYTELSTKQVETMFKTTLDKNEDIKLGDLDAHEVVYNAKQQNMDLRFHQVFAVQNNKAYILTFTAKQDTFDKMDESAQKAFETFRLK